MCNCGEEYGNESFNAMQRIDMHVMDSVITCLLFHKFTQSLSHFCCLDSHFRCLDSHFHCLNYEYIYLLFQTLWQYINTQ